MIYGSLIVAWPYAWADIWSPLAQNENAPPELFMELYPELVKAFQPRTDGLTILSEEEQLVSSPENTEFFEVSNDPELARAKFQEIDASSFVSDRKLSRFFEEAFFIIEDYASAELTELYVELIRLFLLRYNLRYVLLEPFQLVLSLSGLFTGFVDQLCRQSDGSQHLSALKAHFERAFQVLSREGNVHDIHKCIGNACNLVEGFARNCPGAKTRTLGDLAKELEVWPHSTIRDALLKLYGFCSDYPSIRHSGSPSGQLRELDLRDALVISTLLLVFSGYFVDLDAAEIFGVKASLP